MAGEAEGRPNGAALRTAVNDAVRKVAGQAVALSQAVAERVGMSPSDLEALDVLIVQGPMPVGRLAEVTGLTTGGVTGLVDRLERLGYARREPDPTDRRRVMVRPLTERAEREIGPHYVAMAAQMEELLVRYTDDELAVVLDFLDRAYEVGQDQLSRLRVERAGSNRRRGAAAPR